MEQSSFFDYIDPEKAKKGTDKCPTCKRLIRWYAKTLDRRLVGMLAEIMCFTNADFKPFSPRDVFADDHHKLCDYNKLHYWKFIVRTEKAGFWKITYKAINFMRGDLEVPRIVWVFNNEVMESSPEMTNIGNVEPRWQRERSDWTMDYLPQIYEKVSIPQRDIPVATQ